MEANQNLQNPQDPDDVLPQDDHSQCKDCDKHLVRVSWHCQICQAPLCQSCYQSAIRIAKEVVSTHHHICDTCGWFEIG